MPVKVDNAVATRMRSRDYDDTRMLKVIPVVRFIVLVIESHASAPPPGVRSPFSSLISKLAAQ